MVAGADKLERFAIRDERSGARAASHGASGPAAERSLYDAGRGRNPAIFPSIVATESGRAKLSARRSLPSVRDT